MDGNRKYYHAEGEFSGQSCSSPLSRLSVGAGTQKRLLCSCPAMMHLQIRLKCHLLAACNGHWRWNAGDRCEEEEGDLQTQSRDERKRRAGVILRKQALRSLDEFVSHCSFSTQLVWDAILGVGQQEALREGVKSPGFSPCFGKRQQRLLLVKLGPASCSWSSWMVRTWPKSLRKCIGGK